MKNSFTTGKLTNVAAMTNSGGLLGRQYSAPNPINSFWVDHDDDDSNDFTTSAGSVTSVEALYLSGHAVYGGTPAYTFGQNNNGWIEFENALPLFDFDN